MNKNLLDSFDESKFLCEKCKKYCDVVANAAWIADKKQKMCFTCIIKEEKMINNEAEYQQAIILINQQKQRLIEYSQNWEKNGYSKEQIKKLLEPLECFYAGLVEEAEDYKMSREKNNG
jgi:hypothetical protein